MKFHPTSSTQKALHFLLIHHCSYCCVNESFSSHSLASLGRRTEPTLHHLCDLQSLHQILVSFSGRIWSLQLKHISHTVLNTFMNPHRNKHVSSLNLWFIVWTLTASFDVYSFFLHTWHIIDILFSVFIGLADGNTSLCLISGVCENQTYREKDFLHDI